MRTSPSVPPSLGEVPDGCRRRSVVIIGRLGGPWLRVAIESLDATVIVAADIYEAVRHLGEGVPLALATSDTLEEEFRWLAAAAEAHGASLVGFTNDTDVSTRLRLFRLGAADCIGAGMDRRELSARLEVALRRAGTRPSVSRVDLGDVKIDVDSRRVWVRGSSVEMTAKEFDLLAFLAARPGKVYGREQLLASVWHSSAAWQQASTVTEHVRRLRIKIELQPSDPRLLRTVRGVGYTLDRRVDHAGADEHCPDTEGWSVRDLALNGFAG